MDEKLRGEIDEIVRMEVKKALEEEARRQQEEKERKRLLTGQQKSQFSKAALCITAFLAVAFLVQAGGAAMLAILGGSEAARLWENAQFLLIFTSVSMYLVAFPVAAALFQLVPLRPCPRRTHMDGQTMAQLFIITMGIGYGGNFLGQVLQQMFGSGAGTDLPQELLAGSGMVLNMLITVFAAPLVEELLFRKYLIDRIGAYGEKTAVLVSGLLFGLAHGNLGQFFYTFGIGIVWAYLYCQTGNVGYTVAFHMLFNLIGGILPAELYKGAERMGDPASPLEILKQLTGFDLEMVWQVICTHLSMILFFVNIACIVGTAVILFCQRKKFEFKPGSEPIHSDRIWSAAILNPGMLIFLVFSFLTFQISR